MKLYENSKPYFQEHCSSFPIKKGECLIIVCLIILLHGHKKLSYYYTNYWLKSFKVSLIDAIEYNEYFIAVDNNILSKYVALIINYSLHDRPK